METRLSKMFNTTNVTKLTKVILKGSYIHMESTKTNRLLFKCSWVLLYFWHSNWYNFGYILGKAAKSHFFKRPQESLKTRQHSYQQGHPLWNYRPPKLLLHFIKYRLDQLNNKHTKIALNLRIQYFEGCPQKNCLLKVWSFLVHPPQNDGPVKDLRNWTKTIF